MPAIDVSALSGECGILSTGGQIPSNLRSQFSTTSIKAMCSSKSAVYATSDVNRPLAHGLQNCRHGATRAMVPKEAAL